MLPGSPRRNGAAAFSNVLLATQTSRFHTYFRAIRGDGLHFLPIFTMPVFSEKLLDCANLPHRSAA